MCNSTIRAAADSLGVSESYLYSRLKNEQFKKRYDDSRDKILQHSVLRLQSGISDAIETITMIMNDAENSPQVRLNAAETILRNCLRLTEQVDILHRIEALERNQDEYQ